jgi:hypothetical protein
VTQVNAIQGFVNLTEIIAVAGIGGGLFVFAIIGCCGTCRQNKFLMSLYSLVAFALMAAIAALGVTLLLYTGKLDSVKSTGGVVSDTAVRGAVFAAARGAAPRCPLMFSARLRPPPLRCSRWISF